MFVILLLLESALRTLPGASLVELARPARTMQPEALGR